MNPILSALSAGYTPSKIFDFIKKAYPKLSSKIDMARTAGFSIDKILKFLSDTSGGSAGSSKGLKTPNEIIASREEAQGNLVKGGLAAALGAGAYMLGRSRQGASPAGQQQPSQPNIGPQPMGGAPVQPSPIQQAAFPNPAFQPQGGAPPSVPPRQAAAAALQPGAPIPPQQASAIVDSLGLDKILGKIDKKGKNIEQIAQEVMTALNPEQKKFLQDRFQIGEGKPLVGLIKDWFQQKNQPQANVQAPQKPQSMEPPSPQLDEAQAQGFEGPKVPLQKGSLVATPTGIMGDIASTKANESLIKDESGKLHRVKNDELVESPLSKKDLADLYDELLRGIETETGEEISRAVNWAGYDPEANELAYLPHGGDFYVYHDIAPEDVSQLTNILNKRKTTGENFIGAWSEGSKSPIGSAMSALIRRLQGERGGKGKEYSKKFKTVYSAIEPAQKALKLKKKKRP